MTVVHLPWVERTALHLPSLRGGVRFVGLMSAVFLSTVLLASGPSPAGPINFGPYQDQAVSLLQQYIRINTSNPPGNELAAAQFFHRLFDAAHIPNTVYMFAPGRADIYAVLRGAGSLPPIVLLSHMDVVQAVPSEWRAPPFSGQIIHGMIYGRGAMDMKDMGVMEAMVMLIAARERPNLKRNLIFLATGDEEVNDQGSAWLLDHHPELVRGAGYLITEGGSNVIRSTGPNGAKIYGIGVAEKAPLWLRLTAHGRGGHGSIPIPDSAPNQLARALGRIIKWQPPVQLIPAVAEYFENIASTEPQPRSSEFRHISKSIKNPAFVQRLSRAPEFNYLIRDTVSLTGMRAGTQTNVIPSAASADLDVRLLPGSDPNKFIRQLRKVIGNGAITIEKTSDFRPPNASPTDTSLYRIIKSVVQSYDPGALVTPVLNSGYTESQMYRSLGPHGIVCYGFTPVLVTAAIEATEHAPNERVPVDQIRRGVKMLYQIVMEAASK
ncbi:MAG: M20/M25/M40 family metallo-hydrolase [Terriglobia bacterium]